VLNAVENFDDINSENLIAEAVIFRTIPFNNRFLSSIYEIDNNPAEFDFARLQISPPAASVFCLRPI